MWHLCCCCGFDIQWWIQDFPPFQNTVTNELIYFLDLFFLIYIRFGIYRISWLIFFFVFTIKSIDRSIDLWFDGLDRKQKPYTHTPIYHLISFFSYEKLMDMNLEGKKYIVSFEVIQKLTVLLLLVVDDDDGHSLKKVI